jgi:excisionase family DNA binding protein
MTELPNKRYFRPDELARILEQPIRTIYYWLENNRIRHLHFGKKMVIPCEEVQRVLREGM